MYIHNDYAARTGEEVASEAIMDMLLEHGHTVNWYRRSSQELFHGRWTSVKAFFAGIHNPFAAKAVSEALDQTKPDIVQMQNLYPLISPAIIKPIKERNIPIVMRCPNYRLFCPNGRHYVRGEVCEKCLGRGHELWCILKNCEESLPKSIGYALRCAFARCTRSILENVDVFIVQSEFQKTKFMSRGIPEERIGILPGLVSHEGATNGDHLGHFVTFVGRVSPEKGIDDFLGAARLLPDISFVVAGDYSRHPHYRDLAPENVQFMGFVKGKDLNQLYLDSRIIVVPSRWYEGFPNVIVHAMILGRPAIASNIGALGSIVDDGVNGLLCKPIDPADLKVKIGKLYSNPELCRTFGENGRQKAISSYTRESIYERLMEIYARAHTNRAARG